jgi:hypothetical protein
MSQGATAPTAPPEPKYDFMLDGEQPTNVKASASVRSVIDTNPDKAAVAKQLSNSSGLPMPTVERNLDAVAAQEKLRAIQSAMQESPILARQLSDPQFAKLAHDDTENLSMVEKAARGFQGLLRQAVAGASFDLSAGAYGLLEGATNS